MINRISKIFICATALAEFCALSFSLQGQQLRRIADLNPGAVGSFPSNFTSFGSVLYFSAYTYDLGRELWKYDGTTVTLVSNINDATHYDGGLFAGNDSAPYGFTVFNGALYFTAYDQRRGGELWRCDGTNAVRVADINPDINDTIKLLPNSSWPQEFAVFNNSLYFSADTGTALIQNYELWRYDGSRALMVTNIHPDLGSNHSAYPNHLTVFNNALYFMADDGVNGYELWKHDTRGTVLLTNINPGGPTNSSYPKYFTPYQNNLYFQAYTDTGGYELWRTDGTNTCLVMDLNPTGSSYPELFTVFQNALFFRATDGTNGFQIWKYDGSALSCITLFQPGGDISVKNLTAFQNALYFSANDGVHGWELWKYDGTSPSLAADINPTGDSFPEQLMVWNNTLLFSATNAAVGYELWSFDDKTVNAIDIFPGPGSSFPFNAAGFGLELCFSANNSWFSDWEPWSYKTLPLQITTLDFLNPGVRINWKTYGGTTNVVQAANQITGPFQDISTPIYIPGSAETLTNYIDPQNLQSGSPRFYRVVRP